MHFNTSICIAVLLSMTSCALTATPAPTTQPAADVYVRASQLITVDGPSNSAVFVQAVPPYPPQWFDLAEKAYKANAAGRSMVRTVPPPPIGRWAEPPPTDTRPSLNAARHIANDIRDAAVLSMLQGRPNEALDLLDDLEGMTAIVSGQPREAGGRIRLLVGIGIDALRCAALLEVSPQLMLGETSNTVSIERVKKLIQRLLDQQSADARWGAVGGDTDPAASVAGNNAQQINAERAKEGINRVNAERTFAAMSLACQLYYADQGTWPEQATDLVPVYLLKLPIDPWGDGKPTFGYQLIKHGRPDGADRPMVFSRCESKDGLQFLSSKPLYSFYIDDGSYTTNQRRKLGQFRDVSFWETK